jgi:hypothetical protein
VVQPPIEPQHAEAGAIVQDGVLERPAARDRQYFTSTWTDSPGSAFSNSFIWRGSLLRVRRSRGRPRSRNTRWMVPPANRMP